MKNTLIIGNIKLNNPFVLAPLAGFTDKSMRTLCAQQGASLVFTEMVSGKGLKFGDRKTRQLLELTEAEKYAGTAAPAGGPVLDAAVRTAAQGAAAFQLFGDDPAILKYAAQELAPCENVVLDLNAGCPVPKIVKNGEGSALLKRINVLYDCVSAMVTGAQIGAGADPLRNAEPKPVTAKIRMGFAKDENVAVEAAKAIEAAGAAAVTVHGRTREQFYEGEADWHVIADVKKAVDIPVIGNGDVRNGEDAIRMMDETGCDGVMIARGALGNPWIFRDAYMLWNVGWKPGQPSILGNMKPDREERIEMLIRHLDMVTADKGEDIAVKEMRKYVGWYTKGMRGATSARREINQVIDAAAMKEILESLLS